MQGEHPNTISSRHSSPCISRRAFFRAVRPGPGGEEERKTGNHVFVSYSRKDQDYTRKLVDHLRSRGFEVWIHDRIDFGDRSWKTVVQAIRSCAAFVVVMTPDSQKSEWVQREIQVAVREWKRIFPLLLRGEGFSFLVTTQYVNVTGGRMPQDFCDRLREVLGSLGVPEQASVVQLEDISPTITVRGVELALIPAGEFTMGSDERHDDEKPPHKVYLDAFYIGKYPITNAQYKRFVKARKHRAPEHWSGGSIPQGKETHPVVQVSWHDARAYCQWMTDETGQVFQLPTEAEWEKAARGTDGRKYPWGNRFSKWKCNSHEARTADTTSVGKHSPQGDSPYGVADMAGNVWEWTSSLFKEYPYKPDDGREDPEAGEDRVLRGGSFVYFRSYCRVSTRDYFDPDSFFFSLGFRVVVLRSDSP